jgi:hypothetical protein
LDASWLGLKSHERYTSDIKGQPCTRGTDGCFQTTDHTRPFDPAVAG